VPGTPLISVAGEDAGGEGAGGSTEEKVNSPSHSPGYTVAKGKQRNSLEDSLKLLIIQTYTLGAYYQLKLVKSLVTVAEAH